MLASSCLPALADPSASQPLRLVIGFPPGGAIDTIARAITPRMGQELGRSIVVENKPGAGGILAMQSVARAAPDGRTLIMGTSGNFAITPALMPDLSYDAAKDFTLVSQVASASMVLLVHPSVPAKTVGELITYARAHPGKLNFSSSGVGGLPHMAAEVFSAAAGIKMTHVAYKGSSPSITDLVGGQVDLTFEAASIGLPYVKAGQLRALAVTGGQRLAVLPDVPPVSDVLPGFNVDNAYGIAVPAGTDQAWVRKVQDAVVVAVQEPKTRALLESLGVEPVGSPSATFTKAMAGELTRWRALIKDNHISASGS